MSQKGNSFSKLIEKYNGTIRQLSLYVIVGGIATIVEWICFYIFNGKGEINYLAATTLAFIISTFANWLAGKLILFKEWNNILLELVKIYVTSIAGLGFNLILMWIMVEQIGLKEMLSKIIATGLVFMWNFLVRKLIIYKI